MRVVPAVAAFALATGAVTHAATEAPVGRPPSASGASGPTGIHAADSGTPCRWHSALTANTTGALLTCTYQHGILRWTQR